MYYTYYRIGLQFSWDLIFAVFADTTASTKIIQRIFSNTHECAPILSGRAMEPQNLFNENFVDSYPRNISPIRYNML